MESYSDILLYLISQKPQKILKENICAEKNVILVILHIQCRRKNYTFSIYFELLAIYEKLVLNDNIIYAFLLNN